ncbi:uncharacterized protein LOC62_07G009413 [Vanrija pseudolonga]|uniref:Uncharacterized protein n=1 Tax=Vanrija pseudolonga TaxID=143232 RepID=A0AAF0YGF2_9TREE|nr:hypothetical protein LOC62_07G009413 [Vanrija pseudolonga]
MYSSVTTYPGPVRAPASPGRRVLLCAVFASLAYALSILLDTGAVERAPLPALCLDSAPLPLYNTSSLASFSDTFHTPAPRLPPRVVLEALGWLVTITAICARVSLSLEDKDADAKPSPRRTRVRFATPAA